MSYQFEKHLSPQEDRLPVPACPPRRERDVPAAGRTVGRCWPSCTRCRY